MAAHTIILDVDTYYIPLQPTTPALIDAYCSFVGNTDGVTNENFQITVEDGDTITWSGRSSSMSQDSVKITEIDYEEGIHLLGDSDLSAAPGASTITGTVINGTTAQVESYIIKFDVFNGGSFRGSYAIDPKIMINPRR